MKQLNLLVFLVVLMVCSNVNSQTIRIRGYIVKIPNDTLYGWIDYSNWLKTPAVIIFRKDSISDETEYYLPTEVRYFELTGFKAFESFPVKWNGLPIKEIHKKQENLYDRLIHDTLFVEVEVKGVHFSLFSFYDGVHVYYFMQEYKNRPLELGYCGCQRTAHEDTEEHNLFRELLMTLAIKHGFRGKLLEKIAYSSINDVPNIINEMNNRNSTFKSKLIEGSGISWFASVGYGYSYLRIPAAGDLYSAYPGTVAIIGGGIDLLASRYFRTLMVRVDFNYRKFSFQEISFDGLASSISVWYQNIVKGKVKLDAGIGFVVSKAKYSDFTKEYLDNLLFYLENQWFGLDARARLLYRHTWEVSINAALLGNITPSMSITNPNISTINLSYHFRRKKRTQ